VQTVERGEELPEVVPNVGHGQSQAEPAYPARAVRREPAEVPLDVTTVQCGNGPSNQFTSALSIVDTRSL
jgi:hypothetical protein